METYCMIHSYVKSKKTKQMNIQTNKTNINIKNRLMATRGEGIKMMEGTSCMVMDRN